MGVEMMLPEVEGAVSGIEVEFEGVGEDSVALTALMNAGCVDTYVCRGMIM